MVVDCFQDKGTLFSSRHLLNIRPSTLHSGSTIFRCLYSTLSLPGAELDIDRNLFLISLLDIGSIMELSVSAEGTLSDREETRSSRSTADDENVFEK